MNNENIRSMSEWLRARIERNCSLVGLEEKTLAIRFPMSGKELDSTHAVIDCTLQGESLTGISDLAIRCPDGVWHFKWIVPTAVDELVSVVDASRYSAPLVIRKESKETDVKNGLSQMYKSFKTVDRPCLSDSDDYLPIVLPAYWFKALFIWMSFINAIEKKINVKQAGSLTVSELVKLESSLNSLAAYPLSKVPNAQAASDDGHSNTLRLTENRRMVKFVHHGRKMGRIRRPDLTQQFLICPYETPESKEIGIDLFLASDAEYDLSQRSIIRKDGDTSRSVADLLSLAVGLVPYSEHSDGPRLMMGGKNLKQAEEGIDGGEGEPPLVPGTLEAGKENDFDLHIVDHRFEHNLGVNALLLLMPYDGLTYEDALVVSKSFSARMALVKKHKQKIMINDDSDDVERNKELHLLDNAEISAYFEAQPNVGVTFCYGEKLPCPPQLAQIMGARTRYNMLASGRLDKIQYTSVLGRGERITALEISYFFSVSYPLHEGDKLTGRHGNKGVVSMVLPDEKMPRVEMFGKEQTADVILSPSSVMGRKNLGQIYEMAHSLLIKAKEEHIDIKGLDAVNGNSLLNYAEMGAMLEELGKCGADAGGAFKVRIPARGGRDEVNARAFAGWQYIARLHHHSRNKLQYRSSDGPASEFLKEPLSCGAATGQRLGEMENWSLLSYPVGGAAEDLLIKLRSAKSGNCETDDAARLNIFLEIMKMLHLPLNDNGSEITIGDDSFIKEIEVVDLQHFLSSWIYKKDKKRCVVYDESFSQAKSKEEKNECGNILYDFMSENGEQQKGLYVNLDVIRNSASGSTPLRKLHNSLSKKDKNTVDLPQALAAYRKTVIELLQSKTGLLRRHLMGRRLNWSGRGVIVPCPELRIDEIVLPVEMFLGMCGEERLPAFIKEFKSSLNSRQSVWRLLDEIRNSPAAAEACSRTIDLLLSERPIWVFMVRQPSLHRHSIQAFRVKCWDKDVIGFPPFATAGFNADFDGDTMAVFLPPETIAKDLSKYSLPHNPGLVGTGKLALADGLDLALGWMAISQDEQRRAYWLREAGVADAKRVVLGDILSGLAKSKAEPESFAASLRELQKEICLRSTASCTLPASGFARATARLKCECRLPDEEEIAVLQKQDEKELKEKVERTIKEWSEAPENNPCPELCKMVQWKVKGGWDTLREMTSFLGRQSLYESDEKNDADKPGSFIPHGFWEGLSADEMFSYAYSSRDAMGSKKLTVATAGYLSRRLAEGLYNYAIIKEDCGVASDEGLELSCGPDGKHLEVVLKKNGGEIDENPAFYPIPDDKALQKALERFAWGRMEAGGKTLLDCRALAEWAERLRNGERLLLRSPLTCHCQKDGGICASCAGADTSQKPFDRPSLQPEGCNVGLTAAQAIGERGTQIAMKRFHDVSGQASGGENESKNERIEIRKRDLPAEEKLRSLLGEILCETEPQTGGKSVEDKLTGLLITNNAVLFQEKDCKLKLNADLPQQMIHYEIALTAAGGLEAQARQTKDCLLSSMEYGRIADAIDKFYLEHGTDEQGVITADDLHSLKSRVLLNRAVKEAQDKRSDDHGDHQ